MGDLSYLAEAIPSEPVTQSGRQKSAEAIVPLKSWKHDGGKG
jgi:hypothetical protein